MITLTVVTPEKSFPSVECDHVTFHAVDGQIGVRAGHAPLVGLLAVGFVQPKRKDKALPAFAIRGGVGQVSGDQVLIISEEAIPAAAVNRSKASADLATATDPTVQAYLRAQLSLPAHDTSTEEHLSGARAALDAAQH